MTSAENGEFFDRLPTPGPQPSELRLPSLHCGWWTSEFQSNFIPCLLFRDYFKSFLILLQIFVTN